MTHNEAQVRWCLENGADPNARNKNRYLDVPSQAGLFASVSTLRLLAAHGANFRCSNALPRAAQNRLKGRMEVLQWLLDEVSVPINQREWDWDPAEYDHWRSRQKGSGLHFAVYANSPEKVRFLLARGGDINLDDNRGNTALDWADKPAREEVFAILDGWGK